MLAQAINSTSAALPSSTSIVERTPPARCSRRLTTRALRPAFTDGNSRADRSDTATTSSVACASVTPGRMRATTLRSA